MKVIYANVICKIQIKLLPCDIAFLTVSQKFHYINCYYEVTYIYIHIHI